MIKFCCPICGHEFSVPEELAGKRQECSCGIGIIFPDAVGIDSHPPKETITNPESMMVWDTIQVVFAPWMIPRIALRCSMFYAFFVASVVLTWEIAVIVIGYIQGIGEPFMDWGDYFGGFGGGLFIFFSLFFTPVLICILLLFYFLFSKIFKINPAAIRAFLLTPTILLLPSYIFSSATMIIAVRDPNFNFSIEKPEWIHRPIFTVLSDSCWLKIGLIVLVGVGLLNALCALILCRQKKQ